MNSTLREAHSTPYIKSDDEKEITFAEKENSVTDSNANLDLTKKFTLAGVHFNAGCSSSSSDLTKVIEFYNDSADADVVEQWMDIYKQQRSPQVNVNGDNCNDTHRSHNTLYTESTESLGRPSSSREPNDNNSECNMTKRPCNRSMDVLPTITEGFYTLEKCVSVEFPSKIMVPPSRLCRSKEMPNIADVNEYE